MTPIDYIAIALGVVFGVMLILGFCNRWLGKWACTKLGWHLAPLTQGFDGASANGTCPRCGKSVLQDSQGNWF